MSPSELTNIIEQFILYVHRNEAHFTYIYVNHTNVSEVDNIYKTFPQMSFPLNCFAIFMSLMTLLTAGALADPRLPETASNVCTTDVKAGWRRPGAPPPQQKSWLRRWQTVHNHLRQVDINSASHKLFCALHEELESAQLPPSKDALRAYHAH